MAERIPYRTPEERSAAHDQISAHLAAGGLLVYPTETVYGLGGGLSPRALRALVALKGPRPFLLLAADPRTLDGLRWTPDALALAERFWPGPLSIGLEAAGSWPGEVVGPDGAVVVRRSSSPAVDAVLAAAGGPVTSTSANAPGQPPSTVADAALEAVADATGALLLDGDRLPPGRPSTIVRCGPVNRLIRAGAIAREEIESVVDLE